MTGRKGANPVVNADSWLATIFYFGAFSTGKPEVIVLIPIDTIGYLAMEFVSP